jgi:hypothetical protein
MQQNKNGALQAAEKLVKCVSKRRFVSGHDLSRAANATKQKQGFAGCGKTREMCFEKTFCIRARLVGQGFSPDCRKCCKINEGFSP